MKQDNKNEQPSQPTAGGVKEEVKECSIMQPLEQAHKRIHDIDFHLMEAHKLSQELDTILHNEIAQPSPSNPSIKDEAKEDLWKMLDIMNDFCMNNIDGYGGSAQQYRTEAYLNKYKSEIFTYTNPSIKRPTEEVRNFDIDVLFAWITKRIDYDEVSEEMTNCVKNHKFEEAAIARDKRDEISKVLTDLRITVFELIEKYQYYTQSAKGLLSIQPDK